MFLYNILTDLYGLSLFLKPRVSDFFHVPKRKKINVWFIVEEKQIDNFFFVITIFLFCLLLLFSNMLFSVFVFIKMNTGSSWVNADLPSIFQKNLYLHLFKCETVSCYEDIFIFKSCYKPNKFLLHFHVLEASAIFLIVTQVILSHSLIGLPLFHANLCFLTKLWKKKINIQASRSFEINFIFIASICPDMNIQFA